MPLVMTCSATLHPHTDQRERDQRVSTRQHRPTDSSPHRKRSYPELPALRTLPCRACKATHLSPGMTAAKGAPPRTKCTAAGRRGPCRLSSHPPSSLHRSRGAAREAAAEREGPAAVAGVWLAPWAGRGGSRRAPWAPAGYGVAGSLHRWPTCACAPRHWRPRTCP